MTDEQQAALESVIACYEERGYWEAAPLKELLAAGASEGDVRKQLAEALGLPTNGIRDGKPVGFAWSYLISCVRDLAAGASERKRHPNDNAPHDPACEAALDKLDAQAGQGVDAFYAMAFRDGWQAHGAAGASEGQEPVAQIVRGKTVAGLDVWDIKIFDKTLQNGTKLYKDPSAEIAALRERIAGMEKEAAAYREAGVWEPDGKKFMTYRKENLNGKAMYVREEPNP